MANQRLEQVRAAAKAIEEQQKQQMQSAQPQPEQSIYEPVQEEVQQEQVYETLVEQQTAPELTPAPQSSYEKEANLRIMRERTEAAERKERELMLYIQQQQLEVDRLKAERQVRKEEPDELESLSPTDYMDVGQVKKLVARELQKQSEVFQKEQQKYAQITIEQQIRSAYPDFLNVVTPENIQRLNQQSSGLALAVSSIPDSKPYEKAVAAYEAIKSLGISGTAATNYEENKQRISQNLAKPMPASAVAGKPLDNAAAFQGPLTPERKRQIREQTAALRLKSSAGHM